MHLIHNLSEKRINQRQESLSLVRKMIEFMEKTGCSRREAAEEYGKKRLWFSSRIRQSENGCGNTPGWIWRRVWAAEGRKNE